MPASPAPPVAPAAPAASAREPLRGEGWALAPAQPGESPEALALRSAAAPWLALREPMPVAAALAEAGQWSLDAGPLRDFDREAWWYRCRFDRPADGASWWLGLDGLATLASVYLNGEPLLHSGSMFRAHVVDLDGRLRAQGNELLIRFDPLADALAQRRPRPRWRAPMVAHQQLRWWRSTLLGRTPGWSPPAAVVGPWRDIWLAPADAARPRQLVLSARWEAGRGSLAACCVIEGAASASLRLSVRGHWHTQALALQAQPDGSTAWQGELVIDELAAWWPHTHGTPARHEAELCWVGADGTPRFQALGPLGFRTVSADTSDGGFGLRVNGVPVFARGVCWVPLDTLRLHAEPARYREVLVRLRDAGVNMVRVGGTMVYEADAFYALCDELGLLVWQELMFANMDYPADDPAFMAEVDAELGGVWPAWAAHASVAVVCGNSEVEQQAAMWGAPRELWQPALFHQHIAQAAATGLPGAVYWPSSASGGAFPFEPRQGTTSYYGVGAYRRGTEDARASGLRFATECLAFAQVPADATLARLRALNGELPLRTHSPLWKARAPRDLGAGWDFDDVRDHYVQALFGEDPAALRMSDPARHLMLGRAAASLALTRAFDQWRSAGSACRGALVWFLRDLWAGAGWGLLDDQGLPKAAFHALARVCQPLHWGVTDDGLNGLTLHAANDRPSPCEGELAVVLYREGEWPLAQGLHRLRLAAHSTQAFALTDWLDGFIDAGWAYRFGPPPADVLVLQWRSGGEERQRVHFIDVPQAPLRRAELGLDASAEPDGDAMRLTLRTRAAARAVSIEAEGWQADDEGFDLAPGEERVLRVVPVPGVPRRPWRASVTAINALAPVTVRHAPAGG